MSRIVLIGDAGWPRHALAHVLGDEPDIVVVAQAASVAEARHVLAGIDVAVMMLGLAPRDAVGVVKELHRVERQVRILALVADRDPLRAAHAVEAGAAGVLPQSASLDEIIAGLRRLAAGEWLLAPDEIVELLDHATQHREVQEAVQGLTPRERDVLQALAAGLDHNEIAQVLGITINTERTHMMNILSKLGVHTRVQALVVALRHGLVTVR